MWAEPHVCTVHTPCPRSKYETRRRGDALLLSACTTGVTQTPLETALVAQFGEDIPEHQRVLIDLNGDGFNDALIYAQGPD